jgi:hypothetical protein
MRRFLISSRGMFVLSIEPVRLWAWNHLTLVGYRCPMDGLNMLLSKTSLANVPPIFIAIVNIHVQPTSRD